MAAVSEPAGYPIRIAVRVDFSDGTQHTYEVRGQDAVPAPGGFWPEGVVTPDVAGRAEHDRQRAGEIEALKRDLDILLAVATIYVDAFSPDEMMTLPERMRLQDVEDVLERRGKRY